MHLQFRRHGKQFFFYTACLQGRPQVLSRLKEGEKRPVLLPPGEAVKAALLAVHQSDPALAMSDFVIMPDHVHFLLIADFDREPGFDPISFIRGWMAESARAIQTVGGCTPEPRRGDCGCPPGPPARTRRTGGGRGFRNGLTGSGGGVLALSPCDMRSFRTSTAT